MVMGIGSADRSRGTNDNSIAHPIKKAEEKANSITQAEMGANKIDSICC